MHYWIENHLTLVRFAPELFLCSVAIFMLLGWLYGRYRIQKSNTIILRDTLATSIFGLSALVLGFTFSNATSHFNERVELVRQQAYAITQVYEASIYLNVSDQKALKLKLQELLETRLSVYKGINNFGELDNKLGRLSEQLNRLNELVIVAVNRAPLVTRDLATQILRVEQSHLMEVFQAGILNTKNHPPAIIERFLFVLLSVGGLLSGYSMAVQKEEDGFLTFMYILLMGITLYVIFSLEFPNLMQNPETLNADLLSAQKFIQ